MLQCACIVGVVIIAIIATIIACVAMKNKPKEKNDYSYIQYLEPEDEIRTTRELQKTDVNRITGCPCGALSPFEIPYYMRGSMCQFGPSRSYSGDPGYFLGRTVI